MRIRLFLLGILLLAAALSGCKSTYVEPNPTEPPMLHGTPIYR